jgi:hypothetical protein
MITGAIMRIVSERGFCLVAADDAKGPRAANVRAA